jgi:hypothetical protein
MPSNWKYEHEEHNKRDNTQKENYRDGLHSETDARSTPEHLEQFKNELDFKQQIIARFQAGMFFRGPYHICQYWTLKIFAEKNNLDPAAPNAIEIFQSLRGAAERDMLAITDAIRAARIDYKYDNDGKLVPKVNLKARLLCDDVKPRPAR